MMNGIYLPITTPFNEDESLNLPGLERNMAFYSRSGLQGYLALGSNGEVKSLSWNERIAVLERVLAGRGLSAEGEKQKVMAGVVFDSTIECLRFMQDIKGLKPDYLTFLAPAYFAKQMTDEALYRHFSRLADAADVPCFIYNAPQFTAGINLSSGLITRLAAHPNIRGVKDSSNAANITAYLASLESVKDFSVMAGSASFLLHALSLGASGAVLAIANVFPGLVLEFYNEARSGNWERAIALNKRLLALSRSISGPAAVKYAMDCLHKGLCGGPPRLPLLAPSDEAKAALKVFLEALCLAIDKN
jgi:4-hydroxy-2-oxoglutarate aldolase